VAGAAWRLDEVRVAPGVHRSVALPPTFGDIAARSSGLFVMDRIKLLLFQGRWVRWVTAQSVSGLSTYL
jgi:hypothetical protein